MAGSGFWAATIPAQNSRITTITATNTIPVQADNMAVDLKAITVAVLMAVAAADMAGIEPRTTRTTRTIHFLTTDSLLAQLPTAISNLPN